MHMYVQVDAKSYYEQRCSELKMAVEKEKHTVRNEKRLGIGFFTFSTTADAQKYMQYFADCLINSLLLHGFSTIWLWPHPWALSLWQLFDVACRIVAERGNKGATFKGKIIGSISTSCTCTHIYLRLPWTLWLSFQKHYIHMHFL